MVNVLDLFSGIGGFSLGLERAGMRTVAFCEIDPFCRKVLAKNFPGRPIYEDIRELTGAQIVADAHRWRQQIGPERNGYTSQPGLAPSQRDDVNGFCIDLICGGFPCQDISVAGKGAGIEGSRSGLWSEYARIIGEVRPRYIIVENVAALLGRGLSRVLGDLAALGFDAEWHCIPASAVGAPHRRDRVWIVAYAAGNGCDKQCRAPGQQTRERQRRDQFDSGCAYVAYAGRQLLEGWFRQSAQGSTTQWLVEPDVGRVAHGVPARVDRLRSLGNAVVPQIPEIIGRAIMNAQPKLTKRPP